MARSPWLGFGVALALVMAAFPSFALADARVSRSGNVVTLSSDSRGDKISNAGTDNRRLISFFVERGRVLRAGRGCVRRRGPRITRVIVTCGAPSQTHVNRVTLRVNLGGGDDTFTAAPFDDIQPRIIADGGAGNDTIYGSTNADEINGGLGDDKLFGLDDSDDVDGGDGVDLLVGGAGDDSVVGGAGHRHSVRRRAARDEHVGNGRADRGRRGPDRLSCGEGEDLAVVDARRRGEAQLQNLSGDNPRRRATVPASCR